MPTSLDSFHDSILAALGLTLDPTVFEDCVADLLRVLHPTLVPVPGGSDQGADGLYLDADGRIMPLVSTVGKQVYANVQRNLTEYRRLHRSPNPGAVLVATSQSLTARRIHNLNALAQKLGFSGAIVYERAAVASLLYRDAPWCKRLLGLAGDLPALTRMPRSSRVHAAVALRGRDDDLAWLGTQTTDCILSGQPGSGKTALLATLCETDNALFVNIPDPAALSAAIRSEDPSVLILDDAHSDGTATLQVLLDVRRSTGAMFRLVLGTWPGAAGRLARALSSTGVPIRALQTLTRDQIVEVLSDYRLTSPVPLVRLIVDQSQGRPGLAITLANLAHSGEIESLVTGAALTTDLVVPLERDRTVNVRAVLASFGVGGSDGHEMNAVASALQYSPAQVSEACRDLAAAGILTEIDERRLAVTPPALRSSIVKDVFFGGALSLPPDTHARLVSSAPSRRAVVEELVRVVSLQGKQARPILETLMEDDPSPADWFAYSHLGRAEAERALKSVPERSTDLTRVCLALAPESTLPVLLAASVGDTRPLNSATDHPLRLIEDWAHSGPPGTPEATRRRKLLASAAHGCHAQERDEVVSTTAFRIALSPQFSDLESDPGSGNTVTFRQGTVSAADVDTIRSVWDSLANLAEHQPFEKLGFLIDILDGWVFPGRYSPRGAPDAVHSRLTLHAAEMFDDIARLAGKDQAVLERLRRIAPHLDRTIAESDGTRLFRALHPASGDYTEQETIKTLNQILKDVALSWAEEGPQATARNLREVLNCASGAGLPSSGRLTYLADLCAASCGNLVPAVAELLREALPGEILAPFLSRLAAKDPKRAFPVLSRSLEIPELAAVAARAVLHASGSSDELWHRAEGVLSKAVRGANLWIDLEDVPEENLKRLLASEDPNILLATLVSCHLLELRSPRHPGLATERRAGLLRLASETHLLRGNETYHLTELLAEDVDLTFRWLRRFGKNRAPLCRFDSLNLKKLVALLSREQRRAILGDLPEDLESDELLLLLLDDDLEAYRLLLQDSSRRGLHLVPLHTAVDDIWVARAIVAADHGYSPDDLARAAYGTFWEWTGNVSDMYEERLNAFKKLERHENTFLKEVARIGIERTAPIRDARLAKERTQAVYGRR